jgi:site-specific recombinase XerD
MLNTMEAVSVYQAAQQARGYRPRTLMRSVGYLRAFAGWLDTPFVAQVTPEHIAAYHIHLTERYSSAVAQAAYRMLRAFFRWACDEGVIEDNPMLGWERSRV